MKLEFKNNINLPNIISLIRIFLIIPMIYFMSIKSQIGIILVVIIGVASDYLDGYFARKLNIITELGKIIDPLADKIFIGLTVGFMYYFGYLELWFISLVLGRDLLIFLGGLYVTPKLGYVLPSNKLGKLTVNILALNLFLILINVDFYIFELKIISSFFIIISFISYLLRVIELLKSVKNQ
jgi:cardiolipin synthase